MDEEVRTKNQGQESNSGGTRSHRDGSRQQTSSTTLHGVADGGSEGIQIPSADGANVAADSGQQPHSEQNAPQRGRRRGRGGRSAVRSVRNKRTAFRIAWRQRMD